MGKKSFQDQGAVIHCFGCGADNENGLKLKSYEDGEGAVAEWRPRPHHCGGFHEYVSGCIIASLIDCHCVNLATAKAYKNAGRAIGSPPRINCVTANINVSFLKPAPIKETLHLKAHIKKIEGRKTWIECRLTANGELCAKGEVLSITLKDPT